MLLALRLRNRQNRAEMNLIRQECTQKHRKQSEVKSVMCAEQPYKKLSTVNTCPVHLTVVPIQQISGLSLVWRNRKAEPAAAKQSPIAALFPSHRLR